MKADPSVERRDGPNFIICIRLSHGRDENGALYFRVKRTDYEEPAWELRDCVPEKAISRYNRRISRKEARKETAENPGPCVVNSLRLGSL